MPRSNGEKRRGSAEGALPRAAFARLLFALLLVLPASSGLLHAEAEAQPKGKAGKKPANGGKKKAPPPKDAKAAAKGALPSAATQEPAREPDPSGGASPVELRGPTRIDFDDRLIQGQTNKSGAVYLFDRKETGISSMVKRRKSFRQLTLDTIYDR